MLRPPGRWHVTPLVLLAVAVAPRSVRSFMPDWAHPSEPHEVSLTNAPFTTAVSTTAAGTFAVNLDDSPTAATEDVLGKIPQAEADVDRAVVTDSKVTYGTAKAGNLGMGKQGKQAKKQGKQAKKEAKKQSSVKKGRKGPDQWGATKSPKVTKANKAPEEAIEKVNEATDESNEKADKVTNEANAKAGKASKAAKADKAKKAKKSKKAKHAKVVNENKGNAHGGKLFAELKPPARAKAAKLAPPPKVPKAGKLQVQQQQSWHPKRVHTYKALVLGLPVGIGMVVALVVAITMRFKRRAEPDEFLPELAERAPVNTGLLVGRTASYGTMATEPHQFSHIPFDDSIVAHSSLDVDFSTPYFSTGPNMPLGQSFEAHQMAPSPGGPEPQLAELQMEQQMEEVDIHAPPMLPSVLVLQAVSQVQDENGLYTV